MAHVRKPEVPIPVKPTLTTGVLFACSEALRLEAFRRKICLLSETDARILAGVVLAVVLELGAVAE